MIETSCWCPRNAGLHPNSFPRVTQKYQEDKNSTEINFAGCVIIMMVASYPGVPNWRRAEKERLVQNVVHMCVI